MIKKILFPVDFSNSCLAIAPYVKRAADILGAQVTLVHVCDLSSHNGFELCVRAPQEIAEEHKLIGQEKIESFLSTDFPMAKCPRVVRSGEAAPEIAEVARTGKFELVVMPTHAGRFRRMLLGSTTAKVLDDVECPVLTTGHAKTQDPRPFEHRVWACAIGLSPDSERVLRVADNAAAAVGAKLVLIHAAHDGNEENARERLVALQRVAGTEAAVRIAAGPVKATLLDAALRAAADVLIIGRSPRVGGYGRLRDLTYSLVRDSPCPVLAI
jgi:nucleotide-binding universal stress UspA family protein